MSEFIPELSGIGVFHSLIGVAWLIGGENAVTRSRITSALVQDSSLRWWFLLGRV
jgi:hypothetical protein